MRRNAVVWRRRSSGSFWRRAAWAYGIAIHLAALLGKVIRQDAVVISLR